MKLMQYKTHFIILLVGLFLGSLLFGGLWRSSGGSADPHAGHAHATGEVEVWTCSMHPQIRQGEPGICPLCGMDLIRAANGGSTNEFTLTMTREAVRLAEIRTYEIVEKSPDFKVRAPGRVVADETRLSVISAHVAGRITSQNVNFTGAQVRKGDVLAKLWSPELVTAQQELIDANLYGETYPEMKEAARQKLRFWGISDAQIAQIESMGKVEREMAIVAPRQGVVISRNVVPEGYVQPGTVLYEIADLSKVWLEFELFEQDAAQIQVGNRIEYSSVGLPGEVFESKVAWVDPVMDPARRTVRIRVEEDNRAGRWRPDMLVEGEVFHAGRGRAADVVVPGSAVMWTGTRSLVYVVVPNSDEPTFESREVVIGERAGDFRVIREGLSVGERVVVNGAFKIDAAFQMQDKFSMMNRGVEMVDPAARHSEGHDELSDYSEDVDAEFLSDFTGLVKIYIAMKDHLVASDLHQTTQKAQEFVAKLQSIGEHRLQGAAHEAWMTSYKNLGGHSRPLAAASSLENARTEFRYLSDLLVVASKQFGVEGVVYRQYCPMAFDDEGGYWLSDSEEIENPYLPETMLGCGEIIELI
jgi:membrane fusion protein, copper/silver efflux system